MLFYRLHSSLFNRSYFSRLTRERRKNTTKFQTTRRRYKKTNHNDEDLDSEEENDDNEFESVLAHAQTYELLDSVIEVLDDLLQQQPRN